MVRDDALIVYVTHENMNTLTNPFNNELGIAGILRNGRAANRPNNNTPIDQTRPVIFRFIGQIGKADMTHGGGNHGGVLLTNQELPNLTSGRYMMRVQDMFNITLEGIGPDAIIFG